MPRAITMSENIRPILAALRTVPIPPRHGEAAAPPPVEPFVTLSREPGAGAWTLAHPLTEALNRECSGGERPWTCWDRELVEKVAADHHIAQQLVDSLEDAHSWLSDFLSSLSTSDSPEVADEARVFGKVASTIRALASAGRVVIVGRGGVFLTRHMPGGVHVRLVAPLEKRVANMAAYLSVSREQAAARVREMTKARDAFYRRYWPQEPLRPELFTATLNTAALAPQTVIRVIVELVREAATAPVANPLSAAAAASRSSEA